MRPLFQYPGTKWRTAAYIWRALGDPVTYAEPFGGGLAVLLARPTEQLHGRGSDRRIEIVNDINGRLVNLYRAVTHRPVETWRAARGPRTTVDLQARHNALLAAEVQLVERLRADPVWCDPTLAGWALYVFQYTAHPHGVLARRGIGRPGSNNRQLHRDEVTAAGRRMRATNLMILCGGWEAALTPRVTEKRPLGVFLDPPYLSPDRLDDLYGRSSADRDGRGAALACREWAVANGHRSDIRIVLAGYADEGAPSGWTEVFWSSSSGGDSRYLERLWLSPHCLVQAADPGEPLALQGRATYRDEPAAVVQP